MELGLGLDTGGTYTDAVIMDLEKGKVLSKSKSMTTRDDLTIGIENAMDLLDQDLLRDVGVVALSSTLATNSVVEGKGCRVALITIGSDYDNTVPADYSIRISGGHDIHGEPLEPLGVVEAAEFMKSIAGKVEGLSISGYLSVRNPEHELTIKTLAREALNIPVVCGHELTSELGFNERTTTCVMNSRLIPIIDELIRSVRRALDERDIKAALMISRGDGSMMRDTFARERPVETILSGPAASLMGAMFMTGIKDAIVMDMGGTTTDIGILRNGRPGLDPEGAVITGKRTRIMAARVYTSGIGGDSRIVANRREVVLTPERVVPLCVAAVRWPDLLNDLERAAKKRAVPISRPLSRPESNLLDTEFLYTVKMPPENYGFGDLDRSLLTFLSDRPRTLKVAASELKVNTFDLNVQKLEELGFVQRIGLTPTDILHVAGTFTDFDRTASEMGVRYLAALAGVTEEDFVRSAKSAIRNKLCMELMTALITEDTGEPDLGTSGRDLLMKAITGGHGKDFGCSIRLDKPIIGIGAPSGVYMRWVGDALGTETVIPEDSDVGNAMGAICSSISESIKFVIRPMIPMRDDARYEVFSKLGREWFLTEEDAIKSCESKGREYVTDLALRNDADVVDVTMDVSRKSYIYIPEMGNLDEITMVINAAGKPKMFSE